MVAASMVFSLLALASAPVGAEPGEADNIAHYSACVGPATESHGFTDMVGSFAEEAANCLAHYGITKGTTETTYSPWAGITRVQMALFMTRAAGPAGISLPAVRDQGFTDIGNISTEGQAAINQVASLEIMEGRTLSQFDPRGVVTRADMANHLAAFLEEAKVGPGGADIEDIDQDEDDDEDDLIFEDIDRLSQRTYRDVLNLFEMGITRGTGSGRYLPEGVVTRAQMAAFIARTLAHTNARPAGLTVQQREPDKQLYEDDTIEFTASVRDSRHRPTEEAPVDLFWAVSKDKALNSDGECVSAEVDAVIGGGSPCEIGGNDPLTDEDGNLEQTVTIEPESDGDLVVWGWTGEDGDEFDDDDSEPVVLELSVSPSADQIRLTHDAGVTKKVRFGKKITLTFLLLSDEEDRIRQEGVSILWKTEYTREGESEPFSKDQGKITTDSLGRAELDIKPQRDPNTSDDNEVTLVVDTSGTAYEVVNEEGDTFTNNLITFKWDDDAPVAETITPSGGPLQYKTASSTASNTIRVTVTDQYGSTIGSRPEVTFDSDENGESYHEAPRSLTKKVNSRGYVDFTYKRKTEGSGVEMVTISLADDASIKEDIVIYWGETPADEANNLDGTTVRFVDKGSNTMVLETGDMKVYIIKYNTTDQANVDGADAPFGNLEKDLSVGDTMNGTYRRGGGSVSRFELTNVSS